MAESKNDQNAPASNQNKGSGSDTASAAKISAGTSVGTVGQSPPMPHQQGGTQSGAGNPAQSSTLASHTSTPLGGQSGGRDQQSGSSPGQGGQSGTRNQQHASPSGSQGQGSQGQGSQGQGSQGQGQSSKAATETVRQTAEQARERAGEVYEDASEWVRDTYESATSWASDAMGRGRSGGGRGRPVGSARRNVQEYVAQNPVMVGLVGLAAGLLLGALLPRTRRENRMFGEWADEVRDQGMRYAQEMAHRGREYVEESFSGEDPRFSKHESEFGPGPGADRSSPGANRH